MSKFTLVAGAQPTVLLLALASAPVAAQEIIPLTVSSGYPTAFIWTATMQDTFVPAADAYLKAAGGEYEIRWTEAFGGQLGGPPDQGELLQIGAADIANVVLPLEQDILPLESVAYIVPFGTEDVSLATRAVHEMRDDIPEMGAAWEAAGMHYLGAVSLDSYHLLSKDPIESVDDLDGLKIGAVGLNQTWIANTGAAPVAITGISVYNDLQTGVIDGVILTPSLIRSNKSYEVANELTLVNFGAIFQLAMAANFDNWTAYPEPVRDALQAASNDWLTETEVRLSAAYEESLALMRDSGINVRELSPEARKGWANKLPNVPKDWAGTDPVRLKVVETYIRALEDGGTDLPRDWLAED